MSHLVVKTFQIPCAHAPALSPFPLSLSLCPKSAAEEVGKPIASFVLQFNDYQYILALNKKDLEGIPTPYPKAHTQNS